MALRCPQGRLRIVGDRPVGPPGTCAAWPPGVAGLPQQSGRRPVPYRPVAPRGPRLPDPRGGRRAARGRHPGRPATPIEPGGLRLLSGPRTPRRPGRRAARDRRLRPTQQWWPGGGQLVAFSAVRAVRGRRGGRLARRLSSRRGGPELGSGGGGPGRLLAQRAWPAPATRCHPIRPGRRRTSPGRGRAGRAGCRPVRQRAGRQHRTDPECGRPVDEPGCGPGAFGGRHRTSP